MNHTTVDGVTVLTFDQPDRLMSMNDRMHWRPRSRQIRVWRHAARIAALHIPTARRPHGQCTVDIELPVKDNRKRDPHNYYPTVKACIDGLVDAGVWPDDDPDHVVTNEPTLTVDRNRYGTVTIRLTRAVPS